MIIPIIITISLYKKFSGNNLSIKLFRNIYEIIRPNHKNIETELNLDNINDPSCIP